MKREPENESRNAPSKENTQCRHLHNHSVLWVPLSTFQVRFCEHKSLQLEQVRIKMKLGIELSQGEYFHETNRT